VHGDASEISAFRVDAEDGRLTTVNQTSTQSKNPVHLAVDPSNRFIVIANHLTTDRYVSNLAVLALRSDGALRELVDLVTLTGKPGPHRVEQPFAKPHQCLFDPAGRFIAVPDKGLDVARTPRR
jgi:6-phosphogluconolactonase